MSVVRRWMVEREYQLKRVLIGSLLRRHLESSCGSSSLLMKIKLKIKRLLLAWQDNVLFQAWKLRTLALAIFGAILTFVKRVVARHETCSSSLMTLASYNVPLPSEVGGEL